MDSGQLSYFMGKIFLFDFCSVAGCMAWGTLFTLGSTTYLLSMNYSLVSLRKAVCISRLSPKMLAITSWFFQPCMKMFREFSHIRAHYYHVELFFSFFEESDLHFQIVTTKFSYYFSVLPTSHKDLHQRVQPHKGPLLPCFSDHQPFESSTKNHNGVSIYGKELFFSLFEERGLHFEIVTTILATTSRFFQPCIKIFIKEFSHIRVGPLVPCSSDRPAFKLSTKSS